MRRYLFCLKIRQKSNAEKLKLIEKISVWRKKIVNNVIRDYDLREIKKL